MIAPVVETSLGQNRPILVNRIAKRSICHVHELPLGNKATSSFVGSISQGNAIPHNVHPRVRVAGFPSSNRDCCHQLFAEHGTQLKKLDLVSTRRVEVRQRFRAEAGSNLSLECVVLLKSGGGFSPAASVCVVVVNLKTQTTDTLLDRTIDADLESRQRRLGSTSRESLSLPIEAAGVYELRTITSIDPTCPGAEAHLLIDSVRVTAACGTESASLASLSCVGRVTR